MPVKSVESAHSSDLNGHEAERATEIDERHWSGRAVEGARFAGGGECRAVTRFACAAEPTPGSGNARCQDQISYICACQHRGDRGHARARGTFAGRGAGAEVDPLGHVQHGLLWLQGRGPDDQGVGGCPRRRIYRHGQSLSIDHRRHEGDDGRQRGDRLHGRHRHGPSSTESTSGF